MKTKSSLYMLICLSATLLFSIVTFAQNKNLVCRIAKIEVDSLQLKAFKEALEIHAKTAVRVEPGVLNLYAVYEKENPAHVIVFEIYADSAAYKKHLQAPHFLKYKNETKNMIKSLQLIETVPIALETKFKSSD